MAVTITQKPQGYVMYLLHDGLLTITSAPKGGGGFRVLFNLTAHGILDGDVIYTITDTESYNGFFFANVSDADNFSIQSMDIPFANDSDEDVTYIKSGTTATIYRAIINNKWSSVHLPITYTLLSDKYPINSVDTGRSVSSYSDVNGLVNLVLSGSLGTFSTLDYIRISGYVDGSLDGVYQIINKVDVDEITIDLGYDVGYAFGGAEVILYYNNYHVRVQVYAGLNANHYWGSMKPYELMTTLQLTPESDNTIKFSVANEIRKQVKSLTNNLTLDSLPNNIDFMTMFYITTQEVYDISNGDEVVVSEQGIVDGAGIPVFQPLSNWLNYGAGPDTNWTLGSVPTVTSVLGQVNKILAGSYPVDNSVAPYTVFPGETVVVYDFDVIGASTFPFNVVIGLANDNPPTTTNANKFTVVVSSNGNKSGGSSVAGFPGTPALLTYSYISAQPSDAGVTITLNDLYITDESGGRDARDEYFAVNSKLPFKNMHSGYMSEYLIDENSQNAKFLTLFERPVIFDGYYFDVSMLINYDNASNYNIQQNLYTQITYLDAAGTPVTGSADAIPQQGCGIIRFEMDSNGCLYPMCTLQIGNSETGLFVSEQKTFDIACNCNDEGITGTQLTWLNYLGAMEQWVFTAQTEHQIDIKEANTRVKNLFPTWPNSYGAFSSTIRQETSRKSCFRKTLRSQLISNENLIAMQHIKTSSLVQIMVSQTDLRTVLVDTDSFTVYQDNDKEFSISFNVEYTDYIPSQSL